VLVKRSALLAATVICIASLARGAGAPLYTIEKTIPLGSGERWDYVTYDPVDKRAYVAHGDHVTVVDVTKGKAIGDVGPFPGGTHGVAISHATGQGFTDDGKAGIVGVFDLATLKVKKTIPAATDADGMVLDPASGHVLVIDGDSGSVTVVDPKTDTAVATINVGSGLEAGNVDGRGHLFVDGVDQHDIVAIDTATNRVMAHWPMEACERPHGIAIDSAGGRIFATCSNKVMIAVDAHSGATFATFPIGAFNDGAAFDANRRRALSANGDGTLTVVQVGPGGPSVLGDVKTQPSARTIAIDPDTGTVFLPAADLAKIDPPASPGGRPHFNFTPGSLKLLVLKPAQ
jgi:YVTN family beta-propeller protein